MLSTLSFRLFGCLLPVAHLPLPIESISLDIDSLTWGQFRSVEEQNKEIRTIFYREQSFGVARSERSLSWDKNTTQVRLIFLSWQSARRRLTYDRANGSFSCGVAKKSGKFAPIRVQKPLAGQRLDIHSLCGGPRIRQNPSVASDSSRSGTKVLVPTCSRMEFHE